jgi:DNA-binding winged helix-turn-helix (wHTH) protein
MLYTHRHSPLYEASAMGQDGNPQRHIRFGAFELDLDTGDLRKGGRAARLQRQPAKVLATLASQPGKLVTREEIRRQIWNGTTFVDFDQSLNFCIRQIRLALDDDRGAPQFVETVPRRGYRFIAPVVPVSVPATVGKEKKKRGLIRNSGLMLGIGLAVVLVGALAYRWKRPHRVSPSEWVQLTDFTDSATSPEFSADGRMLAFLRGPDTFNGPGQVYVKMLPDGEAVQLTHDSLLKMSPVFSPDDSRIAYTIGARWDTWVVPTLGGEPRLMLTNASGLTWIGNHRVLFSEIKNGRHMGVVAANESRAEERDIYLPRDVAGMAHRSALSPDGKWLLIAEMDSIRGWLPCRLVPFDGSASGKPIGAPGGHCTSAAWSRDGRWMYFSGDQGGTFHIWRERFPAGKREQVTSGPTEEEGIAMAPDGRSFVTSVGMVEGTVWVHGDNGDHQISSEGYAEAPTLSFGGKQLFYLVRPRARGHFSAGLFPNGELWVTDLSTNQAEAVLPGVRLSGYSVSRHGQRVACSTLDGKGKSHLLLASLDRNKSPEQIRTANTESEDTPIFGSNDDLFFRGSEKDSSYLYRIKVGATLAEKVTQDPIIELESASPDERWVVAQVAVASDHVPRAIVAYPMQGGPPLRICQILCSVSWTSDGQFVYVYLLGTSQLNTTGKTFVIPLRPGNAFPQLPTAGVGSEADLAALPGVKTFEGVVSPGPDVSHYAFTVQNVHRNLYRIPTP